MPPSFYRDVQAFFDGKAAWNSVPPDTPTVELLLKQPGIEARLGIGTDQRFWSSSAAVPEAATALAAAMDGRSHLMPIAETLRTRFAGVSVEQNEVRGSVRVAGKEFDGWLAAVYARLSAENVARSGGCSVIKIHCRDALAWDQPPS
jgi:hypothetical protein